MRTTAVEHVLVLFLSLSFKINLDACETVAAMMAVTREILLAKLQGLGIQYDIFEHAAVSTVEAQVTL